MKNLPLIFTLLLCSAVVACSDDEGPKTPPVAYDVISFETDEGMVDPAGISVEPGSVTIAGTWAGGDFGKVFCGKGYMAKEDSDGAYFDGLLFTTADERIGFGSFFADNKYSSYGAYDVWGGFVLSRNFSRRSNDGQADYKRDAFSAWTTTAAEGTETFAIAYVNGYGSYAYNTPKIELKVPRTIGYMYMANATVAAQYTSTVENYWFKVVVTGYLKDVKGKSVEQVLISGTSVIENWVKIDCSPLGEVDELRFDVESNDMNGIYLNPPAYFCIDEIAFVK